MNLQTRIPATVLLLTFSLNGSVLSDDSTNDSSSSVRELRAEIDTLRQQVALLMVDQKADEADIEALTRRVTIAKQLQMRMQALFTSGAPGGDSVSVHQSNVELRIAEANLSFARRDFGEAMKHMNAAVAASKRVPELMQGRLDAGTVDFGRLLEAHRTAIDTELARNRMRKQISILTHDSQPTDR